MLQIILIVLLVTADQLAKYFLVPLIQNGSITVIPGVFKLSYVGNEGASFGILQGSQILFIVITIIVLGVGAVMMVKTRKRQSLFLKISLSLVISGALGNFIDRVVLGYVRDMFDFSDIYFPWIFNIADMCLVIGAILLGVYVIFMYKPKEKTTVEEETNAEDNTNKDAEEKTIR